MVSDIVRLERMKASAVGARLRHGDGDAGAAHEAADDGLAQVLRDPAQPQQADDGVHDPGQESDLRAARAAPSATEHRRLCAGVVRNATPW